VLDFDESLITREHVWLDTGSIVAQLSAEDSDVAAAV
jgi:hypothetical protein